MTAAGVAYLVTQNFDPRAVGDDVGVFDVLAPVRALSADLVAIVFPWLGEGATLDADPEKAIRPPADWLGDTPVSEELRMIRDAIHRHFPSMRSVDDVASTFAHIFMVRADAAFVRKPDEGTWEEATAARAFEAVRSTFEILRPHAIRTEAKRALAALSGGRSIVVRIDRAENGAWWAEALRLLGWRPLRLYF